MIHYFKSFPFTAYETGAHQVIRGGAGIQELCCRYGRDEVYYCVHK